MGRVVSVADFAKNQEQVMHKNRATFPYGERLSVTAAAGDL